MTSFDRRGWGRVAAVAALVILAGFSLSVNLFPNVNNDGVEYIAYSRDLWSDGLVHLGYRQIGYPLLLALERLASGLVGIEALLFTVLVQRLLLVLGVGYAVWLWRWKSAPVVLLAVTPSLLAYTNFVLTEGISVPLGLLLACLVAHHFTIVSARSEEITVGLSGLPGAVSEQRLALATAFGATAISFLLLAIRLPFAVFGIVPVVFWIAARRRRVPSMSYGIGLLIYVVAAAGLTIGMAVENSNEVGVFTPLARSERSLYWSAWHLAFTLHPENRTDAELADFYDDGSPYFRIWAIEEESPEYPDQARALNGSITALLDEAGLSLPRERLFSFLGAVRGGRNDDVRPRVEAMLDTDASNVDSAIHWDDVSKSEGWDVFNDRYNDGAKPQAMITSPVFPDPPLPYVTTTARYLLPLALLAIAAVAVLMGRRLIGIAFLVPPIVFYAAHGWLLADNARFLMTMTIFAIAGLSALWSQARPPGAPRYRLDDHHAIDHL